MILAAVLFFIFNDERYQILRGRIFVLLAVTTTLLMTNAINVTYHHLINYALHISLPISLLVYTIMIILLCVLRDREY
jgi:inner membrane protein involved in colicin E2 resistance